MNNFITRAWKVRKEKKAKKKAEKQAEVERVRRGVVEGKEYLLRLKKMEVYNREYLIRLDEETKKLAARRLFMHMFEERIEIVKKQNYIACHPYHMACNPFRELPVGRKNPFACNPFHAADRVTCDE